VFWADTFDGASDMDSARAHSAMTDMIVNGRRFMDNIERFIERPFRGL